MDEEYQAQNDEELKAFEEEAAAEYSEMVESTKERPLITGKDLRPVIGPINQEENSTRISQLAKNTTFPKISLEEYKSYYDNPLEHPATANFSSGTREYHPSFKIPQIQDTPEAVYQILKRLLFCGDRNITKQHATKHEDLEEDLTGKRPNFAEIGRKEIPTASILYYCCSDRHERNGDRGKSRVFHFYNTRFCSECQCQLDVSNYVALFDLREQVHLKLLSFPKQILDLLLEQHKQQSQLKGEDFDENTVIHDSSSGLLNHVLRKNGFYESSDLGLLLVWNTDGVALERDSNLYKDVWGVWLAFASLPVELRFLRENMVLLGLYSNKENVKLATSTLAPFMEQINRAYDPWEVNVGELKLKVRLFTLGTTLDGVEIPRVFNVFAHSSYFQCCICDFCGKRHSELSRMYFYRDSTANPESAR